MTLQRFFVAGLLVFLLGLSAVYAGANRAPFRDRGGHPHGHSAPHADAAGKAQCLPDKR